MSEKSTFFPGDETLAESVLDDQLLTGQDSFIKMHRLTVRLPNGKSSIRDVIRHPGACAIVALDSDGKIVLERQWRAPLNCAFWEIPAGKIDPNEPSLVCAKRELSEETGLVASRWTFLGTMHNAIGYSDEHIDVYLAEELSPVQAHLDENEFLRLERRHWKDVLEMALSGEISDAKTICAMLWLEHHFRVRNSDGDIED